MAKYLENNGGFIREVQPLTISTGVPDAAKVVQTDGTGRIDNSLMPVGVSPEVVVCASFENLTAGNFVNLFLDGGLIKARKADATNASKPAHGFVLDNVTAPANATVHQISQANTAMSGMTIGAHYWLATTAGNATDTAPSASGNLVQLLGVAHSATSLVFTGTRQAAVELV